MTTPRADVGEIDGSIDDFMRSVRAAFDKQFPRGKGVNGELAEPGYWMRDIFEDRVIVEDGDQLYRVDMTIADGRITFASRQEWGKVRLSYIREYIVGEFRGDFPAVPTAAGVDLDALKSDDKDPFFVTLPVAGVNAMSANGLLYDEALVNSIVEQINRDHPTGIMGHLRVEDLGTAYPEPGCTGSARPGPTARRGLRAMWSLAKQGPCSNGSRRLEARRRRLSLDLHLDGAFSWGMASGGWRGFSCRAWTWHRTSARRSSWAVLSR
jgi:hypothetical protein